MMSVLSCGLVLVLSICAKWEDTRDNIKDSCSGVMIYIFNYQKPFPLGQQIVDMKYITIIKERRTIIQEVIEYVCTETDSSAIT